LWGDAVITEIEDDKPKQAPEAPVKKRTVKKAPTRKK
jgi:hypothetical protein